MVFALMAGLLRIFPIVSGLLIAGTTGTTAGSGPKFSTDIAPLLQRRCAGCHGEENAKGHYRLDTFARLTKTGDSDLPPLVAGKPRESELYRLLIESDATERMPQKADPLPAAEIALIEHWIASGAEYDGGATDRPLAALARGAMLRAAPAHYPRPAPITALAFSPDARRLAVGGYYEVTIWNLDDTQLVRRIGGLPERITGLAWHPQTGRLAVAGGSPAQWGSVALVDPATDAPPRFLCDLSDTALCVAFSPDGTRLAAGGADRALRLFDTASGQTLRVLRLHADWVQSVAFDESGGRIVTASRDRTAKVLEVATGALAATYSGVSWPL
jgi:Planctomycete cytochrome C/WD domain, G-beta repeat